MNRIFNIISWLGIALVLAAVGVRAAVGVGYMTCLLYTSCRAHADGCKDQGDPEPADDVEDAIH